MWTQLQPGGATPPARKMHGLVKVCGAAKWAGRLKAGTARVCPLLCSFSPLLTHRAYSHTRTPPCLPTQLAGSVVLFGGEKDTGPADDVWVLTGAQGPEPRWTQVSGGRCAVLALGDGGEGGGEITVQLCLPAICMPPFCRLPLLCHQVRACQLQHGPLQTNCTPPRALSPRCAPGAHRRRALDTPCWVSG